MDYKLISFLFKYQILCLQPRGHGVVYLAWYVVYTSTCFFNLPVVGLASLVHRTGVEDRLSLFHLSKEFCCLFIALFFIEINLHLLVRSPLIDGQLYIDM